MAAESASPSTFLWFLQHDALRLFLAHVRLGQWEQARAALDSLKRPSGRGAAAAEAAEAEEQQQEADGGAEEDKARAVLKALAAKPQLAQWCVTHTHTRTRTHTHTQTHTHAHTLPERKAVDESQRWKEERNTFEAKGKGSGGVAETQWGNSRERERECVYVCVCV